MFRNRRWRLGSAIVCIISMTLGATTIAAKEVVAPEIVTDSAIVLARRPPRVPALPPGAAPPVPFPTLSTPQIDRQLELYLRYLAKHGRPDILVVGSSRALQGVDPIALQQSLANAGHPQLKVFNFGINGATAQVVELLLVQLLKPEQWPRVIVWADGVRAFNSGRPDRTYEQIARSPGFQKLRTGTQPQLVPYRNGLLHAAAQRSNTLNDPRQIRGLLIVPEVFVPDQYFQQFPKIAGQFDGDYVNFSLDGMQASAMTQLLQQTRQRQIPMVFVNLPLTDIYLDQVRDRHERSFHQSKKRLAEQGQITFIDMARRWPQRYDYFADPSHLNQRGAQAVATVLGRQLGRYFEIRLGLKAIRQDN